MVESSKNSTKKNGGKSKKTQTKNKGKVKKKSSGKKYQ